MKSSDGIRVLEALSGELFSLQGRVLRLAIRYLQAQFMGAALAGSFRPGERIDTHA